MLFKVEYISIPETYVKLSMKTKEFDEFVNKCLDDEFTIYKFKGARYCFFDDDFVVEELL